jgi:hypothetical protein
MENGDGYTFTPPDTTTVNRVTIKPPPFWKSDLTISFAQIALSGITNDSMKYFHIISSVDTGILTQVTNIIQTPLTTEKYVTLKKRLIDIYTDSKKKKL